MARPMTGEERISSKIERYKARKDQWDLVQILSFPLTDGGAPSLFYSQKLASGTRPDGSAFVVTIDEDNPQNNYAVEAGARVKDSGVALLLHIAKLDTYGGNPIMVCRCMPWAFGGDKWETLKIMCQGDLALFGKVELLVRCSPTKDEKFQELVIQFAPDAKRMMPAMMADPTWTTRIVAEYQKGVQQIRDFLKPDSRAEQIEAVRGQLQQGQGGQGQGRPPGGMDLTGLPAVQPSFAPVPFQPPTQPTPTGPGIPGFAAPGQSPTYPPAQAAPAMPQGLPGGLPGGYPQQAPPTPGGLPAGFPGMAQGAPAPAPAPLPFVPGNLPNNPMLPGSMASATGIPAMPPVSEVEDPNAILDAMMRPAKNGP